MRQLHLSNICPNPHHHCEQQQRHQHHPHHHRNPTGILQESYRNHHHHHHHHHRNNTGNSVTEEVEPDKQETNIGEFESTVLLLYCRTFLNFSEYCSKC